MKAESKTFGGIRLGLLLQIVLGVTFAAAGIAVILLVRQYTREQALTEAESKARIILDRNLATHTYFSHQLKPHLFEWTAPLQDQDYFDPVWMSSTYAVREIDDYFQSLNPADYYYKEAAIDARTPENEADAYERQFLEQLNQDPELTDHSLIRTLDGKPYFVTLRRGEVMETSCLRCHSTPEAAPQGLVDVYGPERSFYREAGEVISAISIRVPLSEAYTMADRFAWRLSLLLLALLVGLFVIQSGLVQRFFFAPVDRIRQRAHEIAADEDRLGGQIAVPRGKELRELTLAFNKMSRALRQSYDRLEERVRERTADLRASNERLAQEVAERKRAEKALRKSEKLLRKVIDTDPNSIFLKDEMGRFLLVNEAMAALHSTTPEEMVGKTDVDYLGDLTTPQEVARFRRDDLEVISQNKPKLIPKESLTMPDGTTLWFQTSKVPIFIKGTGHCVLGVAVDITERKRTEEALRQSEERFRMTVRLSPIGVGIVDSAGQLIDCNAALAEMVGYRREEFLRLNFADFTHPDDLEREWQLINELWETKTTEYRMEKRYIHRDGHIIWVDVAASLFKGQTEELEFGFAFVQDITERKRAREQIQASLREKEILLKEIHHRVKNNLAVISALLDFQAASIEDDRLRAAFEESQLRIHTMARVHEHLYRSPDLARVDMAEYIQNLGDYLYQSFGAYALDFKIDIADVTLDIDTAIPCGLVVNELVSNALKHAFPEGQRGEVWVALHADGERYELVVGDNGVGLPADLDLETENLDSLGLTLVNLLIDQLDGTLELDESDGTVFKITFAAPESGGNDEC